MSRYRLIGPLAYMGKKGCTDMRCRRYFGPDGMSDDCIGWHCSYCDAACSSQGHRCDAAVTILGAAERIARESE